MPTESRLSVDQFTKLYLSSILIVTYIGITKKIGRQMRVSKLLYSSIMPLGLTDFLKLNNQAYIIYIHLALMLYLMIIAYYCKILGLEIRSKQLADISVLQYNLLI